MKGEYLGGWVGEGRHLIFKEDVLTEQKQNDAYIHKLLYQIKVEYLIQVKDTTNGCFFVLSLYLYL